METEYPNNSITKTLHYRTTNLDLLWKWRWKSKHHNLFNGIKSTSELTKTIKSIFLIYNLLLVTSFGICFPVNTISSQAECDWNGRGPVSVSSSSGALQSVQTIALRCTRGRIYWEEPKGGLRVTINPNLNRPYKLCLEDIRKSESPHRVLLEEEPGRLLEILTGIRKESNCYQVINRDSVVLYVESHGGLNRSASLEKENNTINKTTNPVNSISISYEVETFRDDGDPCRPCSEAEILKTYCSADVVARGSILQVIPGPQFDSIYIRSDLIIHQNQPVFTPLSQYLRKFLIQSPSRYDLDKPQKTFSMKKGQFYGGIVSHPSTCSASVGEGENFLWLIKFRFGRPMTDCVIYWDKWEEIVKKNVGECPLSNGVRD